MANSTVGMALSTSQQAAIACVTAYARSRRDDALAMQEHICRMSDIAADELRSVLRAIQGNARVALHFHPDRPCPSADTVARGLLVFFRESAVGERDLTVPSLLRRLRSEAQLPVAAHAFSSPVRNLNHYVEAQVHGDIELRGDVDALVVDPSFQNTETGGVLLLLCERYDVQLRYHHGFRLAPEDVPRDFRGPTMPSLARRVAQSGFVDASAIGAAVGSLHVNPGAWRDRGAFDEVLQELKLLWHVVVRYGSPVASDKTL